MKILFLAHRIPYPPNKGEKTRCFNELRFLSQEHCIDLFCFADSAAEAKGAVALEQWCRKVRVEVLPRWTGLLRGAVRTAGGEPISLGYYDSKSMRRAVSEACRTENYDLIFIYCSSVAQLVPQPAPAPVIVDFVDADSAKWKQYAKFSSLPKSWLYAREGRLLAAYEQQIAASSDLSLVTTPQEMNDLGNSRGSCLRIAVVENGVAKPDSPLAHESDGIRKFQPYVVFIGTMDYRPNEDAVCYFAKQILPLVRVRLPHLQFLIVGRDPGVEVRKLQHLPGVIVTGAVEDVHQYLAGASCVVAPFRMAQGVQNKVLEALVAGVPIVLTSRPARAVPDAARELLQVADEPAEFANAVARTVEDPAYLLRARASAARMQQLLSWDAPLQKLAGFVRALGRGPAMRSVSPHPDSPADGQFVFEENEG